MEPPVWRTVGVAIAGASVLIATPAFAETVGATADVHGFTLDRRYWDANEDITNFAGEVGSDQRVVLTLRRAL